MWWFCLQSLIVFAVVSANIYFEITPNKTLAGVAGVGFALIATLIWNDVAEIRARKKRGPQR
jgi:hypothetical protein